MKKGPVRVFRRRMGALSVIIASLAMVATTMGASAASVAPHASTRPWVQLQGRSPFAFHPTGHLQGTLHSQSKVRGFIPSATAFTLSSTTTVESCQNVIISPTDTTLRRGKFSEYIAPAGAGGSQGEMLNGDDGGIWYGSQQGSIVRVAHDQFTTCAIPTPDANVISLTNGPDGAIWFTEISTNKIGRLQILKKQDATDIVSITEFSGGLSEPAGITVGPDDHLWFAEYDGNKIDRMAVNGSGVSYALPTADSEPVALTAGPDHAVWFTEINTGRIGRITTLGFLTEFSGFMSHPLDIINGPDHNLWFTDPGDGAIGRITTNGATSVFGGLMAGANPVIIINRSDNKSMAFTEGNGVIGLITKTGRVSEIGIPHATAILGIADGGDNSLWINQYDALSMGKFTFK